MQQITAATGWGDFDELVRQAAAAKPSSTFNDVVKRLPERIAFSLIGEALHHLTERGLLDRGRGLLDGAITPVYIAVGTEAQAA